MTANWDSPTKPTSEEAFNSMMLAIDQHLNGLDLHIHQRPFHAVTLIATTYGEGQPIDLFHRATENIDPYSVLGLMNRAREWYDLRFGDDIRTRPTIGYFLVALEHRLWKVRAPGGYGSLILVCDRQLQTGRPRNLISRAPIQVNMLDCFEGMTQAYATSLTDDAIERIEEEFMIGLDALSLLDVLNHYDEPLFDQARADYIHSVEALVSLERSYGKSRRDTATSAEKVMKGLLAVRKIPFKLSHNLSALAESLRKEAGLNVNVSLAAKIGTDASVSYDKPVTKSEALEAHTNLQALLSSLLPQIVCG
ncbi:hypothetical protein [Stenotrophomonas sp. HMWF003]|uniref:hypothetical protein n=1 Tax=Stenotrophomonas sp. HMWF003 TaxID=2056840 RepID=UPI000D4CE994|nr:hypothetical protein [Stenotrophomonas sp. HMWF003]PTT66213.1 hypothetical protein DBR34_00725 [Stenotrophomonas sp. HMWF003]